MEVWLPMAGFESHYHVSNLGRIKRVKASKGAKVGKIIKPSIRKGGYYRFVLNIDGDIYYRDVHRMVCLTFHGEPPASNCQAAHCDGDKLNNKAENLRWATPSENRRDCIAHGTHNNGENHYAAKLTNEQVRQIRKDNRMQKDIAKDYGICRQLVSHIKLRKRYSLVV